MADKELTTIVTVPMTCSRSQKEFPLKLPLDAVGEHVDLSKQKVKVAVELSKALQELEGRPDLIVFYKGRGVVFANVHESQDVPVQRLVNLIAKRDIFDLPEPTKRKGGAKGEKGEETETSVEVDEEG
jgi:hypothetical protein